MLASRAGVSVTTGLSTLRTGAQQLGAMLLSRCVSPVPMFIRIDHHKKSASPGSCRAQNRQDVRPHSANMGLIAVGLPWPHEECLFPRFLWTWWTGGCVVQRYPELREEDHLRPDVSLTLHVLVYSGGNSTDCGLWNPTRYTTNLIHLVQKGK